MELSSDLTSVLWRLGGLLCHQIPERSPQFQGAIFPQCFRCAGLYLGIVSSFAYLGASGGFRRRLPDLRCSLWICMLIVPLMVDGCANLFHFWSTAGWVRALTGVGVGTVVPLLLVPLVRETLGATDTSQPTLTTPLQLLVPLAVSITLVWIVANPGRLWVFNMLAVAASCAPAVFIFTFLLAGWRNRTQFARSLRVAPPSIPC